MKMHKSITAKQLLAAVEASTFGLDNTGFCVACGNQQDGCEPDARKLKCENCGKNAVYGAQELLLNVPL